MMQHDVNVSIGAADMGTRMQLLLMTSLRQGARGTHVPHTLQQIAAGEMRSSGQSREEYNVKGRCSSVC